MSNLAFEFQNFARGALAVDAGISDVVFTLEASETFPEGISEGFYMSAVLFDTTDLSRWEIVKVTGISGHLLTVVRAQEGTAARNWAIGTPVLSKLTAGQVNALVAASNLQEFITDQFYDFASSGFLVWDHEQQKLVLRTITAAHDLAITDGDGVNGNPRLDYAEFTLL